MHPALILVHGAGRAGRMWRRPARELAGGYRVVAPDLPGFTARAGGPPDSAFALDRAATAVTALARDQRRDVLRPVHLVGLSLGGIVALHAAAERPELFASLLVTGAPVAPGRRQADTVSRYRRIPERVARLFSDAEPWQALVDELARIDIRSELPDVRVPTLVVWGVRDRSGLPDARLQAVGVPGARLLVLPHLGHGWPVTAPGVFASVLRNFHASVEASDRSTESVRRS